MAVFDEKADKTLEACQKLYQQRGTEYSDSWATENIVTTMTRCALAQIYRKHPHMALIDFSDEEIRLLQCASLIDIKDSRLGGPWKDDSIMDGINYRAVFCQLMNEYVNEDDLKSEGPSNYTVGEDAWRFSVVGYPEPTVTVDYGADQDPGYSPYAEAQTRRRNRNPRKHPHQTEGTCCK